MIVAKTFVQAVECLDSDFEKSMSFLTDNRLTQLEKSILRCAQLIRNNKHQEAIEQLESLKSEDRLVESLRLYFIGTAYDHLVDSGKAASYLIKAIALAEHFPIKNCHFKMVKNLFYAHLNAKNVTGMKTALERMQKLRQNSRHELAVELATFSYLCVAEELDGIETLMTSLEMRKDLMSESQIICFYIDSFDVRIKNENFPEAHATLEQMKKHRKYLLSANFKFMQALLMHLTEDKPIYLYDKDFQDSKILFYQLKVIMGLESQEVEVARNYWSLLKEISPRIYGEDFNYQGDKCLFSLCLKKHLAKKAPVKPNLTAPQGNHLEKLMHILENSQAPLKKEELFKAIWGEEAHTKEDMVRLSNLISRAKKRTKNLEILSRKGCYILKRSA